MKLKHLETPRIHDVSMKIKNAIKMISYKNVRKSDTFQVIKEFNATLLLLIENSYKYNSNKAKWLLSEESFTQDESSRFTFKEIQSNNKLSLIFINLYREIKEVESSQIINLSLYKFDYVEQNLPTLDLNDLNQNSIRKIKIANLKSKFCQELRNGLPVKFFIYTKIFGNNILSLHLTIKITNYETDIVKYLKLCSDQVPKFITKIQKRRIKMHLRSLMISNGLQLKLNVSIYLISLTFLKLNLLLTMKKKR